MTLPEPALRNRFSEDGDLLPWNTQSVHALLSQNKAQTSIRTTERAIDTSIAIPKIKTLPDVVDENNRPPKQYVLQAMELEAKRKRTTSFILQEQFNQDQQRVLFVNDKRGGRSWVYLDHDDDQEEFLNALIALSGNKNVLLWPVGPVTRKLRAIEQRTGSPVLTMPTGKTIQFGTTAYHDADLELDWSANPTQTIAKDSLSHLDRLEADSIHIMREVVAQAKNPGMLFSLGKDSCVMLHLAKKAFYPSPPPFPLIHVDTQWKFQSMYRFRDEVARTSDMELIVHINPEALEKDINPFDHGSEIHTHVTKTEGLIQVLDKYSIDFAIGGARRDEEKSRAKERVFSMRNSNHRWDPKQQRPELWDIYNGYKEKGASVRVFPLSDWTELDVWEYIFREKIPIVPLYYASYRPVVERDGVLILVDDDRFRFYDGEKIHIRKIRFRTLGCYPLTGALESDATDLSGIVLELLKSSNSERQGRVIDLDSSASMEMKKQEGYF